MNRLFFGSYVEYWTHKLLFMSHKVPSLLNTNAKLVQNKQLWRQSGIYHIIKAVLQVSGCTVLNYHLHLFLFLLVRGLSAQMIMCAFSVGMCIQYTIIDLLRSHGIQFISFCFHLIVLWHCNVLEIKFNI